jgi:hypothetical protein
MGPLAKRNGLGPIKNGFDLSEGKLLWASSINRSKEKKSEWSSMAQEKIMSGPLWLRKIKRMALYGSEK